MSELENTELESFESEEIEQKEFIDSDSVISIVESVLFSSPKPTSFASLKLIFKESEQLYNQSKITVNICELRNLRSVSYLITRAAQNRKENVGLHFKGN